MTMQRYEQRRIKLAANIKSTYPHHKGIVCLFANYETPRHRFWQDSTFYYFTGLSYEPGAVALIDLDGAATLYLPQFSGDRSQWVATPLSCNASSANSIGFKQIVPLGPAQPGYAPSPSRAKEAYEYVLRDVTTALNNQESLFVDLQRGAANAAQWSHLDQWCTWEPQYAHSMVDIAPLIAQLRRKKDAYELDALRKAATITRAAHKAAEHAIQPDVSEAEIEAKIGYEIHRAGARYAFPPIVASGPRATILHYEQNDQPMASGDLVIVDIGASWHGYAADLSRTYAVSGTFNERQKFLYQTVLNAQTYIIEQARPGMWLSNADKPQQSLHHLACTFFEKHNLKQYFVHGIGHFLGLDVHDVGNPREALGEGDVITVEPGLYLRDEGIGIRIEDDVVITSQGAARL